MLQIAAVVSQRSVCERLLQVGAVVTDEQHTRILGIGYNGPPAGMPHKCRADEPGNCGCVHAEANALIKSPYPQGRILYATHSPCESCAALIINAGIYLVVYREAYRLTEPLALLRKAGVSLFHMGTAPQYEGQI
jgi:dCMP deaminase